MVRAWRSRSRSARTCGRTAGRCRSAAARGRPSSWCRTPRPTSGARMTCAWTWWYGALARRGPRWPTPTWSAGRTSWSSTATRSWSPQTARWWPAGRSSRRRSSSRAWACPRRRPGGGRGGRRGAPGEAPGDQPVDAQDGTVITIKRVTLPPSDAGPADRPQDPGGPLWPRLSAPAEVYAALVTGVRDYVRKNGFRSAILALSGGIDSALTATIAVDAIGADNVHVVLMPSRYSSEHSVRHAEDLVKRQGVHAVTIPIATMVDAFIEELTPAGFPETGLPAENLQARVRGVVLMGLSNAAGHLVLTTGNKSELAAGYSTL